MQEETLSRSEIYAGRLVRLEVHDVALRDGRRGVREIIRHPGAAAIVAQLPDGRFVFVRQYRKAVDQDVLELPAGCLESGETPEQCALREVREETGYAVRRVIYLGSIFTSPGMCDETLWLYYASLKPGAGQRLDPDENVDCVIRSEAEIDHAMLTGDIRDAKTLAAWWLFKQIRPDGNGEQENGAG